VAIDNARAQEKQVQLEKTELKMELFRERELRETLEKQLAVEQKNRGVYYTHTNLTKSTYNLYITCSLILGYREIGTASFYSTVLTVYLPRKYWLI